MGFLFSKQYLPYQLLDAFGKAEKYAYMAKDTLNAIVNYQNRGDAYYEFGKKDIVLAINMHAAKMFKKYGYDYAATITRACNYELFLEKKDTLKAKEAFRAYLSTRYEGNSNYEDAKAYILYQRGRYYMLMEQLDSAYCCFQQSLNLSKSYSVKTAVTKVLAQYYAKVNQPLLAMKYAMQSSEYNDSDLVEVRKTQLQQIQAMYDYGRNQELARVAVQKAKKTTQSLYISVLVGFVIFILMAYVFWEQLKKKKKKIAVSKCLYEDCLLKLKQKQEELALLKTINDRKLTKVIKEKEETVNKLKEDIRDIRDKFSNSSLSDVDILLKESSIYKRIRYIELHPKVKMTKEDWTELDQTIERLIPSFIPLLKNRLNETDYRICLLVRLEISTSTMAALLDLSPSAISKYRKVMLKKLCGKVGKPKDFDEYIQQIQ